MSTNKSLQSFVFQGCSHLLILAYIPSSFGSPSPGKRCNLPGAGGGEAARRTADGLPHCKTVEVERLDERVKVPVGAARGAGDRLLNRKIVKYKCWPRC